MNREEKIGMYTRNEIFEHLCENSDIEKEYKDKYRTKEKLDGILKIFDEQRYASSLIQPVAKTFDEYSQVLLDWDNKKISDEEMKKVMDEFYGKTFNAIELLLTAIEASRKVISYTTGRLNTLQVCLRHDDTEGLIEDIDLIKTVLQQCEKDIMTKRTEPVEEIIAPIEEVEILDLEEPEEVKEINIGGDLSKEVLDKVYKEVLQRMKRDEIIK